MGFLDAFGVHARPRRVKPRAVTDLRPLGDGPAADAAGVLSLRGADDPLVDVPAESPLEGELI